MTQLTATIQEQAADALAFVASLADANPTDAYLAADALEKASKKVKEVRKEELVKLGPKAKPDEKGMQWLVGTMGRVKFASQPVVVFNQERATAAYPKHTTPRVSVVDAPRILALLDSIEQEFPAGSLSRIAIQEARRDALTVTHVVEEATIERLVEAKKIKLEAAEKLYDTTPKFVLTAKGA